MKSKEKILIVEDELKVSKAYAEYFDRAGYEVAVAHDGEEGLKVVQKFSPDIILLDIIMPVMDGLTMLKSLRALKNTAKIPIIMLTNLDAADTVGQAMAEGSEHYLVKANYSLKQLEEKVRQVLDSKK